MTNERLQEIIADDAKYITVQHLAAHRRELLEHVAALEQRNRALKEERDLDPLFHARQKRITELEERNRALEQQVAFQADDVKKLDELCWDCTDPDVGAPWRHVHEIDGKERAHWHHTPDPGDGLPSACKNSDRFEEVFQETQQRITELESTVQAQADTLAKLREALMNAPHSQLCGSHIWKPCDCWKAKAEAALEATK